MMNKLLVLLAIILLYFLIVFMFYPKIENMSTLDDGNDSDDKFFHGEFGTVKVKTASNGDRVIVAIKPNYKSYSTKKHVLYGAEKQTITIYKTDNGKYAIVDEKSIEQTSPNQKKVMTYYGNTGSVTIRRNSDGTRAIINFQTNMVVDDTSINTFYGPDGNSVDIIRTPDGNLKIVTESIHSTSSKKTTSDEEKNDEEKNDDEESDDEENDDEENDDEESEDDDDTEIEEDNKNDYIRKSQIVPPVCPACPSVTSCAKVNSGSDDENSDEEGDDNYTKATPSSSSSSSSSKQDQSQKQAQTASSQSSQQTQYQQSNKNSQQQSNNGKGTVKSNETQNIIRGPRGNVIQTQGKVGMYLGDNSINQEPMPILNNFSTFAT